MPNTKKTEHKAKEQNEFTILLAHGSSDKEWSATFDQMTKSTRLEFTNVSVAFMELSKPSMEDVIRSAVSDGFKHITVIPLFLAAGKHLKLDVPKKLNTLKIELGISYDLHPPIGEHPLMATTIKEIISETLNN